MSVLVYNRFVAMLALAALAAAVVLALPAVRRRMPPDLGGPLRVVALLVALTATLGSLAYSEVFGFEPCRLCWYQRVAMYPLVVVLGVGVLTRDPGARRYVVPLAGAGLAISAYHYLIQVFPTLDAGACAAGVPCTARYVEVFGFVSIPFMAAAGFAAIISLVSSTASEQQ